MKFSRLKSDPTMIQSSPNHVQYMAVVPVHVDDPIGVGPQVRLRKAFPDMSKHVVLNIGKIPIVGGVL